MPHPSWQEWGKACCGEQSVDSGTCRISGTRPHGRKFAALRKDNSMARMITEVSRDVYQAFVGVPTVRDTPLGEAVFLVTPPLSELQIPKKSDNRQAATKKAIRNKPPPEKAGSFSRFSVINHVSCISMCGTRGCRTPVPNLHTQSPSGFTRVFWPARLRSKALPS